MRQPTFLTYAARYWEGMFYSPNMPLQPSNPNFPEGFFHYTSLSAAEKILNPCKETKDVIKGGEYRKRNQNDYITLLASHFLFLNDSEELFQGIKEIEGVFKYVADSKLSDEIKERLKLHKEMLKSFKPNCLVNAPNFFILCFCSEGNLLTQWEWYGRDCGIAIEFDLNNCGMEGNIIDLNNKVEILPFPIRPYKIMYTEEEKLIAKSVLKKIKLKNEYDVDNFSLVSIITAAHMKHISFQNEKETRVLIAPLYKEGTISSKALSLIKYREANGVIKPFIEVHIKHNEPGKCPIKSVTVGPGNNQSLVYNAVQKLIHTRFAPQIVAIKKPKLSKDNLYEHTTIGDIDVRRSLIPFRG